MFLSTSSNENHPVHLFGNQSMNVTFLFHRIIIAIAQDHAITMLVP